MNDLRCREIRGLGRPRDSSRRHVVAALNQERDPDPREGNEHSDRDSGQRSRRCPPPDRTPPQIPRPPQAERSDNPDTSERACLGCECSRSDCHDFVTAPRAAFADLFVLSAGVAPALAVAEGPESDTHLTPSGRGGSASSKVATLTVGVATLTEVLIEAKTGGIAQAAYNENGSGREEVTDGNPLCGLDSRAASVRMGSR